MEDDPDPDPGDVPLVCDCVLYLASSKQEKDGAFIIPHPSNTRTHKLLYISPRLPPPVICC
jgi:hypothetical protein